MGGDEGAVFICTTCGRAHEPSGDDLLSFWPLTAAITTELAVAGTVRYLAVWRVDVEISEPVESAWARVRRVAAPEPAYLYVPAFSLMRPVVQMLGVSLTEAQPVLQLTRGLPPSASWRPAVVDASTRGDQEAAGGAASLAVPPEFGLFSPVVLGRQDARALAHFVYLAVESHETRDLRSVDYALETKGEELLFLPAVWDPRHIHESNWRLLLREFDGLVA
jgi:hypothetical protein